MNFIIRKGPSGPPAGGPPGFFWTVGADGESVELVPSAFSSAASLVAEWFVDSVNGNDTTGNGLTELTAFKTVEHLSQVISPGGTQCLLQVPNVFVHLAPGSYGQLNVNIEWFAGAVAFTNQFVVDGKFATTGPIVLNTSIPENVGARTRAEITTLAGAFVAGRRIRSQAGVAPDVQLDRLTYSTGLVSATDTFSSGWLRYVDSSQAAPTAGQSVFEDTLGVTIESVIITNSGAANPVVQNLHLTRELVFTDESQKITGNSAGGALFIVGCDLDNCELSSNTGASLWSSRLLLGAVNLRQGDWSISGCAVQGTLRLFPDTSVTFTVGANCFDGGKLIIGKQGGAAASTLGFVQFANGVAGAAITLTQGSSFSLGSTMWSGTVPGSSYTDAVDFEPDTSFTTNTNFSTAALSIAATNGWSINGVKYPQAAAPISVRSLGVVIDLNNGASGQTEASLSPPLIAQSANIPATNLTSVIPRSATYIVDGSITATTAGGGTAVGSLVLNVIYTDVANIVKTVPVATLASFVAKGSAQGIVSIETNGATQVQFSVTGIVTPAALQYAVRMNCRISSNG